MSVTQRDVAGKLGLSQRAVAFALSDTSDARRQLRPETRQRILDTARLMGYVPHQAARRLARTRSTTSRKGNFDQIGMLVFTALEFGLEPVGLAMMSAVEQEIAADALLTFVRIGREEDWRKVER